MHAAVAVVAMGLLAAGELFDGRSDRVAAAIGRGRLARIDPHSPDPTMWRWGPGIGPVLAERLAAAGGRGVLRGPGDVQGVSGIGPVLAGRLRGCVRWDLGP